MSDKQISSMFAMLGAVIGFMAGIAIGVDEGVRRMRHEAVKQGAAEYVATPDGRAEFKWRTTK